MPFTLLRHLPPVRHLAAMVFLALLPTMMWAALQPQFAPPAEHSADKFLHIAAFGFMAALGWTACSRPLGRSLVLAALSGFGALIEVAQAMVPGREASLQDWMADTIGILAGIALMAVLTALLRPRTEAARG